MEHNLARLSGEDGISLKKVLELEPYRIDRMSVSEREKLPYLHECYVKHYDLLKRIPCTLIFKARRSQG